MDKKVSEKSNLRISGVHHSDGYCMPALQTAKLAKWGSEIRPSLDFEWSKRGWVANGLDFEWHLKSRNPTI